MSDRAGARPPAAGPRQEIPPGPRRVVVQLPYGEEGALDEEGVIKELASRLATRFPDQQFTIKPVVTAGDDEGLESAPRPIYDWPAGLGEPPPPLPPVPPARSFLVVDNPPEVDPQQVATELSRSVLVDSAYVDYPADDPHATLCANPITINQGYLDPAPQGVDARYAWPIAAGGSGDQRRLIDLERGWTLDHEALVGRHATILYPPGGTICDGSRFHGTGVLGVICALQAGNDVVGMVPNIGRVDVVSYCADAFPTEALKAAIQELDAGDVLLIEAEGPARVNGVTWTHLPLDARPTENSLLRSATDKGIVVVAAAGNGNLNLDKLPFADTGAIMVGSARPGNRQRVLSSNYGSRIDCYAWGEQISTCCSDEHGSTTGYQTGFGGTSGAAAIIAGVVLLVQSMATAARGAPFTPATMRGLLRRATLGTPSNSPTKPIGAMPSVRKLVEAALPALAHA